MPIFNSDMSLAGTAGTMLLSDKKLRSIRWTGAIILAVVLFAGMSCRKSSELAETRTATEGRQPEHPGRTKIAIGQSFLWVEVADQPRTREQGLMFRKSMPQDEGMLFIFEYSQMQSFWMKNTYIPLDIAFLSDQGVIINICTMKPLDEGPRYQSLAPALYAIETNAGWFEKNGVKAGDRVRF